MSLWFANEWYVFPNAINKETINKIRNSAKGKWQEAKVGDTYDTGRLKESDYRIKSKVRTSDIYWTSEKWIYDITYPFMLEANKRAGWKLDIKGAEPSQIARYRKGCFYDCHKDGASDSLSAYDIPKLPVLHGNVRKISLTLVLNDEFEGGEFEFAYSKAGECIITPVKVKAGDMIFFTSGIEHRITPVTKGTRYSLVTWFIGPPVK